MAPPEHSAPAQLIPSPATGAAAATSAAPAQAARGLRLLSPAQAAALRDVLTAFAVSRLVIWVVGLAAALLFVPESVRLAHVDPAGWTAPFDSSALNLLVAPGARFDSAWLLEVTHNGYAAPGTPAFFPLYPALSALAGGIVGSDLAAGIAISALASIAALYLVHRLVALDFGRAVARRTVWLMSCLPTAYTFTAVYTEGLFLLLSVGSIYAARLGRWPAAALAAALAASTRSAGALLIVPLALLYLYGPRADRAPDRPRDGRRPSYRLRPGALAIAAPLAGVVAFAIYLGIETGNPLAMLDAQQLWERAFDPLAGLLDAFVAAGAGAVDLVAGTHLWTHTPTPRGIGLINIALLASLLLGAWLAAKSLRRLPPAYSAYSIATIALPLSSPAFEQPLMSMPRFLMVAFPLWLTAALLIPDRARWRHVLELCFVLLALCTALFAGWMVAP